MSNVSVLIPTFKRPELLGEAIDSCLNQSCKPFEILVGDDSPDDLTQLKINAYQSKSNVPIKYKHNVPSLNQAGNINMLFQEAKGDKIILLHDDDLLVSTAIETLLNCFHLNPDIDIAYGKQYIISQNGEIDYHSSEKLNRGYFRTSETEGCKLNSLEAGILQQFPNDGYMLDAKVIKHIQYRNYSDIGFIGDGCEYDFGILVGQYRFKTYFVNSYTAKYRVTMESMSTNPNSNFAYYAFKILENVDLPKNYEVMKSKKLSEISPIAIVQVIYSKSGNYQNEALRIYFSKYHRMKIFSLGGIRRFFIILYCILNSSFFSKKI